MRDIYGVDVEVTREENPDCEKWRSDLNDRYVVHYEEVDVLEMCYDGIERNCIEIVGIDGEVTNIK